MHDFSILTLATLPALCVVEGKAERSRDPACATHLLNYSEGSLI